MQRFVARENIKRFRTQLDSCNDAIQRAMLEQLLTGEEANLKAMTLGINAPKP